MARKVKSELRVFAKNGKVFKIEKRLLTLKTPQCIFMIEKRMRKNLAEYHCKSDGANLWDLNLDAVLNCFSAKFTAKICRTFALKNPTKQSVAEIFNERNEYEVVFNDVFPVNNKFKSRLQELAAAMKS